MRSWYISKQKLLDESNSTISNISLIILMSSLYELDIFSCMYISNSSKMSIPELNSAMIIRMTRKTEHKVVLTIQLWLKFYCKSPNSRASQTATNPTTSPIDYKGRKWNRNQACGSLTNCKHWSTKLKTKYIFQLTT